MENKAEEVIDRAYFELQDAKVNFFQEKAEFDQKQHDVMQQRTYTSNFNMNKTTQSSFGAAAEK